MKNLEFKVKLPNDYVFPWNLDEYLYDTLQQVDKYYDDPSGKRLKFRFETSEVVKSAEHISAISYSRPDICGSRESVFHIYEFKSRKDYEDFMQVFGSLLRDPICTVSKKRVLFLCKNARIHFDIVDNLGSFLEFEVLIRNEQEQEDSASFMQYLIDWLKLQDLQPIATGYKDLLLKK